MAIIGTWNATLTNQTGNDSIGQPTDNANESNFMVHLRVIPLFLVLCIVLGIIGNAIALWHIIRKKQFSSPTDVLLLDLIIMNILIILASGIAILEIEHSFISVQLLGFIDVITNVISLYGNPAFMTCIAVDQYIAIVHPITFHAWRKPRYYVVLSLTAWLTFLTLGVLIFFHRKGTLDNPFSCRAQVSIWERNLVLILCTELVVFFIPILILLTCYALSAKKLIEVGAGKESMEMMKKKVLRTILAILALLLLCFAPFHVIELSFILRNLLDSRGEIVRWYICNIRPYTWAITSLNTVLNPLLYIFRSQMFQWKTVCCSAHQ
ncbi:mu-type opioid receptor-like [Scyliorhinus canicula]|uniref:mu-type opioid receptor-like n=1 Tax=Scyliorhinus canicula TaxID=7830 RepID=UPI0018F6E435|nr:mu-type opioid receptor-like [Scyliorhinus canicula]